MKESRSRRLWQFYHDLWQPVSTEYLREQCAILEKEISELKIPRIVSAREIELQAINHLLVKRMIDAMTRNKRHEKTEIY